MAKEKNENNKRSFRKDFKAELKKVVWPTSKQMVTNVTAVLTIVIITALIVFVLDFAFGALNNYGINKLKEKVSGKNQTQVENVLDNTTDGSEDNKEETSENSEEGENNSTENTESAN